ncbi:MAG: hypothetical protein JW870_03880 [Candidatus Delongbacteria bacterium]|nr:hypothetical protein [Candidatus Delongbacteria bacterium]
MKEVFETALPSGEYDKYIELETGEIYTGGLLIGKVYNPVTAKLEGEEGLNVKISGNGAIIDLQGSEIVISFCKNRLDIDNCIILNGGIKYRGDIFGNEEILPFGTVEYVTFYKPYDYAVKLKGAGKDIIIRRNIAVDAVDTGAGFQIYNSMMNDLIKTGMSFGLSGNYGGYGIPEVIENWSYHSDDVVNADLLNHFGFL